MSAEGRQAGAMGEKEQEQQESGLAVRRQSKEKGDTEGIEKHTLVCERERGNRHFACW